MNTGYKGTSGPSWQWACLKITVTCPSGKAGQRGTEYRKFFLLEVSRSPRNFCLHSIIVGRVWATAVNYGDYDSKERN